MNENRQNSDQPVTLRKFSIRRWLSSIRCWFVDRRLRIAITLPDYAGAYVNHLVGEYNKSRDNAVTLGSVINKLKDSCSDLTWGDLYSLERALAATMSVEEIHSCLGGLRFRLKQVASKEAFQAYESSWPKESKVLEELRAELRSLIDLLHWYYFLLPILNRRRKHWVNFVIWWLVVWTLIVAVVSGIFAWRQAPPLANVFVWIFYLGVVGGYISALRRIQALELDGDPLVSIYRIEASAYALWLSPLLGGTFAIILSLLFIGGVLSGKFFPSFEPVGTGINSLHAFLWAFHPKDYSDYALLLVWSFVAGFAERLVPDTLDKMIAEQKVKSPSSKGS
jgi:hypothetical protein